MQLAFVQMQFAFIKTKVSFVKTQVWFIDLFQLKETYLLRKNNLSKGHEELIY